MGGTISPLIGGGGSSLPLLGWNDVYPAVLVCGGTISPLIGGGGLSLPLLEWNDVFLAILVLWGHHFTPFLYI